MKTCKTCKGEITSKYASTYCSNKCKFSDSEYNKNRIKKLNFVRIHFSKPNYWYTRDYSQKYHRYNFTKGSVVKKYGLDPSKTEFTLMEELGYDRVWDCGNIKYEWNRQQ